jgi:hypothetical protein
MRKIGYAEIYQSMFLMILIVVILTIAFCMGGTSR